MVCPWGPSEALSGCSGPRHCHPRASRPTLDGGPVAWAKGSASGGTQPRFCVLTAHSAAVPSTSACALDLQKGALRAATAYRVKEK